MSAGDTQAVSNRPLAQKNVSLQPYEPLATVAALRPSVSVVLTDWLSMIELRSGTLRIPLARGRASREDG